MARPDFTNSDNMVKEIIRVNHAGEYGAKRIYQGQLNYSNNPEDSAIIKHMLQQEEAHLSYFSDLLVTRNVRPTILLAFWHIIGYALGSGSILFGKKMAMLLTEGVEEVIEQHYGRQIDYLIAHDIEKKLQDNIQQFQFDEVEHKNKALAEGSQQAAFAPLIKKLVKLFCNKAISLSKKF
jgi:ubiquinone biosynthesis monooxygenase Coq7